jgi:hypothetical protein
MKLQIKFYTYLLKFFVLLVALLLLNQCGIYRKTDARKVPVNANERVKKNMEEGRRIKFGQLGGLGNSGKFEFATSNEMWRATIDVLDFLPLSSVDYGGGVIISDWYNENSKTDSIKIMVQFLSNEIRADGLKVIVYNKSCEEINLNNCSTKINESNISEELKLAILKKAAKYKSESIDKEVQEYKKKNKAKPSPTGGEGVKTSKN